MHTPRTCLPLLQGSRGGQDAYTASQGFWSGTPETGNQPVYPSGLPIFSHTFHVEFIFYYVEDSLTWYCSEVAVAYDKSGGCQQSSASASCSLVASCTNCIDILGGTLLPNKQTKNRNKTKQNNTAATAVRSTWNLPCFTTNLRECKTDWLKSGENHQTQTCSTDVTGTHQRRPESPTAALTWQASKYQRLGSLTVCI